MSDAATFNSLPMWSYFRLASGNPGVTDVTCRKVHSDLYIEITEEEYGLMEEKTRRAYGDFSVVHIQSREG